jgi:hypothetical protein
MSQENIERARGLLEAIAGEDYDAALALVHPHVELFPPGNQTPYKGAQSFRRWMEPDAFSRQKIEPLEFVVGEQGRILGRQHIRFRGAGSGIEMEIKSWSVWSFDKDGLITGSRSSSLTRSSRPAPPRACRTDFPADRTGAAYPNSISASAITTQIPIPVSANLRSLSPTFVASRARTSSMPPPLGAWCVDDIPAAAKRPAPLIRSSPRDVWGGDAGGEIPLGLTGQGRTARQPNLIRKESIDEESNPVRQGLDARARGSARLGDRGGGGAQLVSP